MRVRLTVVSVTQPPVDVLLDVEPGTTVREVRAALTRALPAHGRDDAPLWLANGLTAGKGDEPLLLDARIGDTGLRDGAVLGFGVLPPVGCPRQPGLELRVVGGPDAGSLCRLPPGDLVLGRGAVQLPLTDPRVSRRHALLRLTGAGVSVTDLDSTNGTSLDAEPVVREVPLRPGRLLRVGDTRLAVAERSRPDASVRPDGNGGLDFNRPPRLLPPTTGVSVTLPEEPRQQDARGFPVVALLVPLACGVLLASLLGRLVYLLFALMSPVLLASNHFSDRRHGRTSYTRRRLEYDAATAAALVRLQAAKEAETQARRDQHPDPAAALLIGTGPGRRVWERRRHDEDALALRVGLSDTRAGVRLVHPRRADDVQPDPPMLRDVPVVVPLREVGVLGVAGTQTTTRALARWLVGQAAVLHSPRDLAVVVLTARSAATDWAWLRWLPHARPADGQDALVLLGNDSDSTARRVAELVALTRARSAALRDPAHGRPEPASWSAVLVVLDGARALRRLPGVTQVLREGPAVGVYAVCLDEQQQLLPEECSATLTIPEAEPGRVTLRRARHPDVQDVLLDQVTPGWAERLARALSPLRDTGTPNGDAQVPTSARLLDLLALEPPSAAGIATGWVSGGRSTRAVVGAGTDGPFTLDLSRDGPHGLVAGTTGSGKSELLQTLVSSLATANRPDEMTFVLVDYKGGSAFRECALLPHTVGMVTDLDTHLVERALVSLGAELRRREHRLAGVGAKDLEDYQARAGPLPTLPRLVIVIDEFASLARELPDFVTGLVDVAQRGRSLGIHLLLATQRPSGVVSPEIRANCTLRIALRVTDPAESMDVVDAPHAAHIAAATPGRAVVRLGPGSLAPFQAGRVGGRRPGSAPARSPYVCPVGWDRLGAAAPRRPPTPTAEEEVTDLAVLVEAVRQAATDLGVPAQPSPWLPALAPVVLLADLPAGSAADGAAAPPDLPPGSVDGLPGPDGLEDLPGPYGLEDLPGQQAQRAAGLDLMRDGHLFAVGASRSGRSQLLRTLAGSLARLHACDVVHLYGVDCASGALPALTGLPHCGAVVHRGEGERAARLLARLTAELKRRQGGLATAGQASVGELPAGQRPPQIVLLIDGWEGFTPTLGELDGGALLDAVMLLLREGAAAGIHLVITGDRSLLLGRIATTTGDKLAFRLSDRGDYSMLGLSPRALPEQVPAGRAFRAESGVELQVALLTHDPSGQAQAEALRRIGAQCAVRDAAVPQGRRPFRVDVLPSRLDFAQAWALRSGSSGPLHALLGVGGDDLAAVGVDLSGSTPSLLVAGPARSGRSTALVALGRGLLAGGAGVVLVAPRPSPLREVAGALAVFTGQDLGEQELTGALVHDGPVAVLVDDAQDLRECGARDLLRQLVKGVPGRALLLAGTAEELGSGFAGWLVDARKARQGALLSPQALTDGDLIGARLPRSVVGQPLAPGRALLHVGDGRLLSVQVPI